MDLNLKEWNLALYRTPLAHPLPDGTTDITRGLILEAVSHDGLKAYGEAVVWPQDNEAMLDSMLAEFRVLSQITPHRPLRIHNDWVGGLQRWLSGLPLSHSLRFAVETAACGLLVQTTQIPLARLFNPAAEETVALNGLIMADDSPKALDQARTLVQEGYRCLKIKCGHLSSDRSANIVQSIMNHFGTEILLRADINRAYSHDEALRWAHAVGPFLEYVEEPCRDGERLSDFHKTTHIPIGLDETLLEIGFQAAKSIEGFDAAIIKPSRMGGLTEAWRWAQKCRASGIKVVISSCFETDIGLWSLAHFAAACGSHTYHGLDTWRWFQHRLGEGFIRPRNGHWILTPTPPRPIPDRAGQWSWL